MDVILQTQSVLQAREGQAKVLLKSTGKMVSKRTIRQAPVDYILNLDDARVQFPHGELTQLH